MTLNFNHLIIFQKVAEKGHFTRAAGGTILEVSIGCEIDFRSDPHGAGSVRFAPDFYARRLGQY